VEVKKYGNRRLYDTEGSRYVTLEEVAERVRLGEDLRVVDAKTGRDLTQVTLAQLILESRGAARLLPVPLLKQLLRMQDDALAEFFNRYVTWALEVYLRIKQGTRIWNPLAGLGFAAPDLLARLLRQDPAGDDLPPPPFPGEPDVADESDEASDADELAQLRRELDELKRVVHEGREPPPAEPPPRARRSK
jgi:polyhydroxyalkanoate synthesis repressor PhaR